MVVDWNLIVVAVILTSISFGLMALFGTRPLAIALVWIITRMPGHSGATCIVYELEPVGPWLGVCEKACKNPWMVNSCYQMSGVKPYESENN